MIDESNRRYGREGLLWSSVSDTSLFPDLVVPVAPLGSLFVMQPQGSGEFIFSADWCF